MKFYRYIQSAINHLGSLGIEYKIDRGREVTDAQILEFESLMGEPLPVEYKEYLKELGDGFRFRYTTPKGYLEKMAEKIPLDPDSPLGRHRSKYLLEEQDNGWMLDYMGDTIIDWGGHQDDLAEAEIIQYLDTDGEEYLNECRRRRRWLPIMGIGGGGYTLNYDYGTDIGAIRYHDIRMPGYSNSAHVADSLEDWMAKWSRYAFSNPINLRSGMQCSFFESYCDGIEGAFPWDDQHFLPEFKIPQ